MNRLKAQLCASLKAQLEGGKARIPEGAGPILTAFTALSRARSYNQFGPNPITWEAMAAWSQMMRVPLQPHHAEIIMALDEVWLTDAARRADQVTGKTKDGVKIMQPISKQAISPAIMDAMFG